MRLNRIKLAGFKSFVDPTTLTMPSNLVGIVGPNGCGKSNTIDAVRWVMGESSAKHLRGQSMDDVIFSGSSSRKPVSKASIELIFDNSDGTLGGEYAKYNEVSIRRQVTRDGQSHYFLNGVRCRRRDITDIFLGTGLGPRSYAIIEQGMISRLIEAKPQELRVYLEEAAGISKYKERRKETETRMRHTRENLDRLNDLRDEVAKQLNHLKRQADTAERYKVLKADERRAKAELLYLKLRELSVELEKRDAEIESKQTTLEKLMATVRETEAEIEQLREQRMESSEDFNAVQALFYQLGNQITQVEQSIIHQRDLIARQQRDRQEALQAIEMAQQEIRQDEGKLAEISSSLEALEPDVEAGAEILAEAQQQLEEAEEARTEWQKQWDDCTRRVAEPVQQAQVERARMEQLERHIKQLQARRERLVQEQARIDIAPIEQQIAGFSQEIERQALVQEETAVALESTQERIQSLRESLRENQAQLNNKQREVQQLRGRLSSLEALQQAALGKDNKVLQQWFDKQGLASAPRLGEQIVAQAPWAAVVEQILGETLEAVAVDAVADFAAGLSEVTRGTVTLFEPADAETGDRSTLWGQVRAPASVKGMLDSIYIAETLQAALARRNELADHESVVTPDGVWMGRRWLRYTREKDAHAGVLLRKQEIESLQQQLETAEAVVEQLTTTIDEMSAESQDLENRRQAQQSAANEAHRLLTEVRSKLSQGQSRLEQLQQRLGAMANELTEIDQQIETEETELEQSNQRRNGALDSMHELQEEQEVLGQQREVLQQRVAEARQAVEGKRMALQEMNLKLESLKAGETATRQNLDRMRRQAEQLNERLEALVEMEGEGDDPVKLLESELESLLSRRVEQEALLTAARESLQTVENRLVELEQLRHDTESKHNDQRAEIENLRLATQEIRVRGQTLHEQLAETEFSEEELAGSLDANAAIADWEAQVARLEQRVHRLGAINLAAIDEFKEQSERKEYLDRQNEDLLAALNTLENAIRKIDHETRERFKETFDKVNAKIQEKFPKLFGGGHAHLEMTDDDLLTTGVAIMARPPGKRISNIHLMSGGEKALTAVAMVFAIFELNPAPFCMLDEVDAPLDEANVGRFCELVKEMSSQVQFIFITHNKVTMEMSEQLIGVTMRESGVSRIVEVDVAEAALMATG